MRKTAAAAWWRADGAQLSVVAVCCHVGSESLGREAGAGCEAVPHWELAAYSAPRHRHRRGCRYALGPAAREEFEAAVA